MLATELLQVPQAVARHAVVAHENVAKQLGHPTPRGRQRDEHGGPQFDVQPHAARCKMTTHSTSARRFFVGAADFH
jgi:hypothetical protein